MEPEKLFTFYKNSINMVPVNTMKVKGDLKRYHYLKDIIRQIIIIKDLRDIEISELVKKIKKNINDMKALIKLKWDILNPSSMSYDHINDLKLTKENKKNYFGDILFKTNMDINQLKYNILIDLNIIVKHKQKIYNSKKNNLIEKELELLEDEIDENGTKENI